MRRFFVFLVAVVLSISAFSDVIERVRVQTPSGTTAFSEDFLKAHVNSLPGTQFDPDVLAEDIVRLYKTGTVSDVQTQVVESAPGRLEIVFQVKPVPTVAQVTVVGNVKVDADEILDRLTFDEGDPLDSRKLVEDRAAIQKYYAEKGFFGTRIEIREEPVQGENRVNLIVDIDETSRAKIGDVEFEGNTVFSDRKLRGSILSKKSWFAYLFDTGFFREDQLQSDKRALTRLYESAGYLDAYVERIETNFDEDGDWVDLVFHVVEGKPYTVGSVTVEGNTVFTDEDLLSNPKLKTGEQFSGELESADMAAMKAKYGPLGYLNFAVIPKRDKNTASKTVDVVYSIREGKEITVGDVYVTGNVVTQDRVIRREIAVEPTELADPVKLETTKKRLENLNYFETVQVSPRSTDDPNVNDIEVAVEETMTGRWGFGGGLSSDDGVFGFFEVQETNFDIARLFDWPPKGAGQRVSFKAYLGTDDNEFIFSFVEPWLQGKRLRLQTDAYNKTYDQDQYQEEHLGGAVQLTRMVSFEVPNADRVQWWQTKWRQSFGYRLEQVSLNDFEDDVSATLLGEEDDYLVSALMFGMTRDTRNSYYMPTRGSRLNFSTEVQAEAIGSYSTLYKLDLKGVKYFSLGDYKAMNNFPVLKKSILKVSGEIASMDRVSGDEVAIFDRYFAGGQYSFRGFDTREISPVDENEDPLGGQSMLLGTLEFIYPFNDMFWGSVFCDFGNVWADEWGWDPGELNVSLGVGLQIDLKMLPIRVDYGLPVKTEEEHLDSGGQFHFSLGRSF
jgi:outer membrane protein insertion porin family